jgi:ABC-type polysaccharide/polyol phosphate export permease
MTVDPAMDRDAWVENAAPTSRVPALRISDAWHHRELIFFFAQRDVKVRYKQAFLGTAWAGLQPLIGALTFTIVFSGLANVDVKGRSYFAFALSGFIVWTYFSSTVTSGTNSLLSNSDLLTKVSFPRIVAPLAALLPALVDLAVGIVLALIVSVATGDGLSPIGLLVGLPLGLVLLLTAATGPVLFFSASIVRYRDASALVTLALQFVLFVSPIAYPPELVPPRWQTLYYANPLASALGLLRAALANGQLPGVGHVLLSFAVASVVLFLGLVHFRANERSFADII